LIQTAPWLVMGWSPQILTVLTILWCKPTRGSTDASDKNKIQVFLWAKEQRNKPLQRNKPFLHLDPTKHLQFSILSVS
jgi:hypothetical protein